MEVLPVTANRLLARVAEAQANARVPSLVAGVVRGGTLAWSAGRGGVDGTAPTSDTQYRIGSITKTFTALLVMRLRDEGALTLTDPFADHVPGAPFGRAPALRSAGSSALPAPYGRRPSGVTRREHVIPTDSPTPPTSGHHPSSKTYVPARPPRTSPGRKRTLHASGRRRRPAKLRR
jgi:D-alanyl-D-alanine carboxypeptidase